MEMQALIEEIALLVEKVKSGTATLGELEAFASAAQQLNERAIILRYKAYEAKVYGIPTPLDSVQGESLNDLEPSTRFVSIQDGPLNDLGSDVIDTSANTAHQTKTEEPIGMQTPVSVEESDDLSFDLFSMEDEDTADFDSAQPAVDAERVSVIEEKVNPVIEEQTVVQNTPVEGPVNEPVAEIVEPTIYPETDVQPETSPTPAAPASPGNEHPVIRKARTNDGSLQSRLLSVRLETLKSAFGLNERMLIVRELFGGSNEAYTEAIEQLDSQTEINSARSKVSDYANQYGWREDNELAIEFVQKVERRYA